MVRVDYEGRILTDYDYLKWLIRDKSTEGKRGRYFKLLMTIKSSSLYYLTENNVILDFDLKKITDDFPDKYNDITSAFEPKSSKKVEPAKDEISKRISFASDMASKKPFKKIYIFTTETAAPNYVSSSHLKNMESVQLRYGEDTLTLLDTFGRQYGERLLRVD